MDIKYLGNDIHGEQSMTKASALVFEKFSFSKGAFKARHCSKCYILEFCVEGAIYGRDYGLCHVIHTLGCH